MLSSAIISGNPSALKPLSRQSEMKSNEEEASGLPVGPCGQLAAPCRQRLGEGKGGVVT